jgi:DNA-binding GntR family transcriptional regulator
MSVAANASKAHQVHSYIKERIIDGTFGPGYRLVLDQLAKQTDVSHVPVREALRRLEAEGYVVYTRNAGASVASLESAAYETTQGAIAFLEGAATALAAPLLEGGDIAAAREINTRMAASRDRFDPAEFLALNAEFHLVLTDRCPNPRILELLRKEQERMRIIRTPTYRVMDRIADRSVDEHEEILALIESDPTDARIQLAAQRHKLAVIDFVNEAKQSVQL